MVKERQLEGDREAESQVNGRGKEKGRETRVCKGKAIGRNQGSRDPSGREKERSKESVE